MFSVPEVAAGTCFASLRSHVLQAMLEACPPREGAMQDTVSMLKCRVWQRRMPHFLLWM